ncbi:endonuclease VII domain-containing protein [Streptomyces sp. ET3-23]|uniref:endonuclease domain-containing protein n=1 Tax=Streptomyces sp. ET3-23 TaxID=2885643 RepID=UPI001D108D45|nr:endonuclease VII domain-containing protein [Streptomyces sp. ET3-23]
MRKCHWCRDWLALDKFSRFKEGLGSTCKDCRVPSKYGMSRHDWLALFLNQGKSCAACGETEPSGQRPWHIDHDHRCCSRKGSCGQCVRAILCAPCNLTLGHAKEDPYRLISLAHYAKRVA